ncbi:unnamed protein product [Alternaria sp. RS040]
MTLSDIAEGLKQRNAVRLNMLKDTKKNLNTIVDELIDEHLNESDQSDGPTKKRRLDESTTITGTMPLSTDEKESLGTKIKNARDNCEVAYKLSVAALVEERKKAGEQCLADLKASSEINQLLLDEVVDTCERARYVRGLKCSPATASICKHILDDCTSKLARVEKNGPVGSLEPERIKTRYTERIEVAWSAYLREEKAYVELLSSLELQASSAGIDLGCKTKEQMLDRWFEEVSPEKEHYQQLKKDCRSFARGLAAQKQRLKKVAVYYNSI